MAARICDVMACNAEVSPDCGYTEDAWYTGLRLFGESFDDHLRHTDASESAAILADYMYFAAVVDADQFNQASVWAEAAQLIREGWPHMEYVLSPVFPKQTKRGKRSK